MIQIQKNESASLCMDREERILTSDIVRQGKNLLGQNPFFG